MFRILYALLWLITWLPLPILYIFSDFCYLIVYYLVGYRIKVVRKNLKNSFPDKTDKELQQLEKKFYHYFCDLFIEVIYLIHMSEDEMRKRMKFSNLHLITDQYDKNRSVMLMTAHYGNWEWASCLSLHLPKGRNLSSIYKQLKDKKFDQLMSDLRSKFGSTNVETQDLFRTILKKRNANELTTYGMISDQTPTAKSTRHWMTFLNQDTTVLVGTEQMAKKFDYPVLYFDIKRVKRGYYSCDILEIELDPKNSKENAITEKYMHILEQKINERPEFWLWTHKRWKHKRPVSN